MRKNNRTWREEQQECQRDLAACDEHAAAVRERIAVTQGRLDALEVQLQEQQQKYNHWLVRWLWDWQLKKLNRQRRDCALMLEQLDDMDQTREALKAQVEQPPIVHPRRVRAVHVPVEVVFGLMLATLIGCLASRWLLHH